jgi:hypothetical protein
VIIFLNNLFFKYSVSQIKVPPKESLYFENQPFDFDDLNAQMSEISSNFSTKGNLTCKTHSVLQRRTKSMVKKSETNLVRSWFCNIFLIFLRYLMYFSSLHNSYKSQKISVCHRPWTVKNVFFSIPGHLETLKTGKANVLMVTFMTNSTPKTALF